MGTTPSDNGPVAQDLRLQALHIAGRALTADRSAVSADDLVAAAATIEKYIKGGKS